MNAQHRLQLEALKRQAVLGASYERPQMEGPYVLFGCGALGRMTLSHMRRLNIQPLAFADNQAARWGTAVDGLPVLSPAEAASRFGQSARFMVTIYNGSAARKQLELLRCTKIGSFVEFYYANPEECLPYCGLDRPTLCLENWEAIESAAGAWADESSLAEYFRQIRWRSRGEDPSFVEHDSPDNCYFPENIFSYESAETFLDCGAFDGDSIRQYLTKSPQATSSRVVAFEPDENNYRKLVDYAKRFNAQCDLPLEIHRCAVGDLDGLVTFTSLGSVTSSVRAENEGAGQAQCRTIDGLGLNPTLIKMDVEGHELSALRGAAQSILRCQPVLAISLYHHAADLWTIPNFISELCPDHSLFLRRYAEDCWELVLYAVPPHRLKATLSSRPSAKS